MEYGQTTIPEGLTGVIQVAAGGYHTLALKSDGKVVAWGAGYAPPYDPYDPWGGYNSNYYWWNNGYGQNPFYGQAAVPADLSDVVQIDAGWSHSTALKSDGTVVEWGGNAHGASGAADIVQISVSSSHTLALKMDGTVQAWGYNWSSSGTASPTPPEGLSNVVRVAAGENFSLALLGNGTVVAWGSNDYGALNVPDGLSDVVDVAAGSQAIALKSDGTLVTWGTNYGQEFDNSQIAGQTFKKVSASSAYGLAINSSGLPVGWGSALAGQLEFWNVAYWPEWNYPGWDTEQPDANWFQKELVQIDAGLNHAVALVKGTRPEIQVEESDGRKFQSNTATDFSKPRTFTIRNTGDAPLTGLALSVAGEHASEFAPVALEKTELQPGETVSVSVNFNAAGAGFRNAQLQIASNDANENPFIVNLTGFGGLAIPEFSGVVVAGGTNDYGQTNVPPGLTGIVQVAAGNEHSLALRKDGRLFSWGSNSYNQTLAPYSEEWPYTSMGSVYEEYQWKQSYNGKYYRNWNYPNNIVQIAAGDWHTLVLSAEGSISGWGADWNGQNPVPGHWGVAQIAAGSTFSVALKNDGKVESWGSSYSSYGIYAPWPLFGVTQISVKNNLVVALKNDGTVVAWGATNNIPNYYSRPWWAQNNNQGYNPPWVMDVFGRYTRTPDQPKIRSAYAADNYGSPIVVAFKTDGSSLSSTWGSGFDESAIKNTSSNWGHSLTILASSEPEIEVESPVGRVFQSGKQALILVQKDQPSASSTLVVKNTGYSNLANLSVSISGPDAPLFSVSALDSNSLSPDGNSTLTVNFTPNSAGTMTATLRIESNDSDEPVFEIPLIGRSFPMEGPERAGTAIVWGNTDYFPEGMQDFIQGLGPVRQIAHGDNNLLFLNADGTVSQWSSYPTPVSNIPADLSDVIQVSTAGQLAVAVKQNGQIVAWGDRTWEVPTWMGDIVQVALGYNYGFILSASGTVTAWGQNTGYGGFLAVPGELYQNTLQIQTAAEIALALKSDGTVKSWGNDTANAFRPPADLNNVTKISLSNSHALALKGDGTVVAWGQDWGGNLAVPEGLSGVKEIAAGSGYSLALKQDGSVVVWGTSWATQNLTPPMVGGLVSITSGEWNNFAFSIIGLPVPEIAILPSATTIYLGQSLSNSTISGGSVTFNGTQLSGYFAFAKPHQIPQRGTSNHKIIFYPHDSQTYSPATGNISITTYYSQSDLDGDGISNDDELIAGTNQLEIDSDSDGSSDYREKVDGTDALNPESYFNLSKGLVAFYQFNGSATDESGSANHGILEGAIFPTINKFGVLSSALRFNGTPASIKINDQILNLGQDGYTISSWFKCNDLRNSPQTIFNTDPHTGIGVSFLHPHLNGKRFGWSIGRGLTGEWIFSNPGVSISDSEGIWYQWTLVKQGTNYRFYLNGELSSEYNLLEAQNFEKKISIIIGSIGHSSHFGYETINGDIDETRIYNRALNETEISQLYSEESRNGLPVAEIIALPTASVIYPSQTLSNSTLSGGSATYNGSNVNGYFAFASPFVQPQLGISSQKILFYPNDFQSLGVSVGYIDVRVEKLAASILTPPAASLIFEGQSLSAIQLSGGTTSVAGSFAFSSPQTIPAVGNSSHQIVFTPTEGDKFTPAFSSLTIRVLALADDEDKDGVSNADELTRGTNPFDPNSSSIGSGKIYADATTSAVGLPRHNLIAVADMDNNGVEDLLVSAYKTATNTWETQFWKRFIGLNYMDATSGSGLEGAEVASVADFNNDGSIDVLHINTSRTEAAFYRNSGNGTFTKVAIPQTESNLLFGYQDNVRAVDMDGDGDLDLVFGKAAGSGGSIVAVLNQCRNGGSTSQPFSGVTTLAVTSWIHNKAEVTDANSDGKPDLLSIRTAGNWSSGTHPDFPVTLFLNTGNSTADYLNPNASKNLAGFMQRDNCGISAANVMSPLASWDVDNDGDLDLINGSSDWPSVSRTHVYINDGAGNYTQINSPVYQSTNYYHHGISIFDADLDNDLDAVWTSLHNFADVYPRMWRNDGNLTFTDVTTTWGVDARIPGSGNLFLGGYHADLDGDGDFDFVCDMGNGWGSEKIYKIYRNNAVQNGANWLGLKLVSSSSAPNGIGTRVEVIAAGKKLSQYLADTTGGTRNLSALRFGLGSSSSASSVKVFWPSGQISELSNVAGNRVLTITETPLANTLPQITIPPVATGIVFGQSLSNSTLTGGTASLNGVPIAGVFSFLNPQTVPPAGNSTQTVVFTPNDSGNYTTATISVTVQVNKAAPIFSAPPLASSITYGQALSTSLLSGGLANIPGNFTFLNATHVPNAGNATYTLLFTPNDGENYESSTINVTVQVNQAVPSITTAPTASNISYGQPLSASSLAGGVASVPGSFSFQNVSHSPPAGSAEHVVVFTPGDAANYSPVTMNITVTVNKASTAIGIPPVASAITYGQNLTASILTGGNANTQGNFTFANSTLVPSAGNSTHQVIFIPSDSGNYSTASANVSVLVNQATPSILTLPAPSAIGYGQTLSVAVLMGGTANVPGSFSFANSTISPPVGNSTQLVVFTPADSGNYSTTTGNITVLVNKGAAVITTLPSASPIRLGQTLANSNLAGGNASVTGTFVFANPALQPASGSTVQEILFNPFDSGNYTATNATVTVLVLDPDGDEDGDGLKNSVETATGVFISATDTGTDPFVADTNNDGFTDGRALGAGLNPLTDYSAAIALVKQLSAEKPGCLDLYTSDAMMDMNIGELVIRKIGSIAEVDIQFQTTPDLATQPFTDIGEPYRFELPMPGNKGFLRVRALGPK